MRVGPLRASSPEEPPLRTWAVSDESVGICGGNIFWSYNIGQLHLGKQIYYHSVKSTLSFFETFPPIKFILRTIVVVCHFKSI